MAKFLTDLINKDLPEPYERYSVIHEPFKVSDIKTLRDAGIQDAIEIPRRFYHDYESIGIFKGSCKRGGVVHDYFSRIDSVPVVSKKLAADIYFEIMEASDAEKNQAIFCRMGRFIRRWGKWSAVRLAWGYFHKWRVLTTCYEMSSNG